MHIPAAIARRTAVLLSQMCHSNEALALLPHFTPRKKQLGLPRKESQRTRQRKEMKEIREEVLKRADGLCEACGVAFIVHPEIDHWLGGSGRRRQMQSVETCWALCMLCHRERTANHPSAAQWNLWFKRHCAKYGYPFTPHIEKS